MNDVDELIKALEKNIEDDSFDCIGCPYFDKEADKIKRDALKLLKSQPQIVRCKDCKHGEKTSTFRYYPNLTWCNKCLQTHGDDWFCADGERKEGR